MAVVQQPGNINSAMEGLLRQGICTRATQQWLDQQPKCGDHLRDELLAQVYERFEESPSAVTEWQAVCDGLDDDVLLAALRRIGPASMRRYSKGERHCSDPVVVRVHWLALLINQLQGTYNPHGICR